MPETQPTPVNATPITTIVHPDAVTPPQIQQPVIPPDQIPVPVKPLNFKTKIIIVVTTVLLIVSILLNFLQFYGFFLNNGIFSISNLRILPISPQKSFITSYGMGYYVETRIREIKQIQNQTEIITEVEDSDFPKIYLQPITLLFTNIDGDNVFETAPLSDFKPGSKIGIFLIYSNFEKWMIVRIALLPS
jgi:hypothetical protein